MRLAQGRRHGYDGPPVARRVLPQGAGSTGLPAPPTAGGLPFQPMAASLTDTHGIIAIAAAAVAVVALIGCVIAGRLGAAAAAGPDGRARSLRRSRTWSPTPSACEACTARDAGRGDGPAGRDSTPGWGRSSSELRGRDLPSGAGPLRRLQRAVRAAVDVDRAARRRTLRDRAVVHPPPRPGEGVRQAGAGGTRRTRAVPRGGRGGAPGDRRRRREQAAADGHGG